MTSELSLREALDRYLVSRQLATTTATMYRRWIEARCGTWLDLPIGKISDSDMRNRLRELLRSGRAQKPAKETLRIVKAVRRWALLQDTPSPAAATRTRRHDKVCSGCGADDLPFAAITVLPVPSAQSSAGSTTVAEITSAYLEHHLRIHSSDRVCRNIERTIRNYFGPLLQRTVCDLKRFDVQRWHGDIGSVHGHATANRAVQVLSAVINKAIDWEMVPADMRNPCLRLKLFAEQPRDRYLNRDETERLLAAIDSLRYNTTRDFILMCLYTGQRRSNVAAMRFDEIDTERAVWRIPKTKNGQSHFVPLIEPALQILNARRRKSASPFVFESDRSATGHLTKPELAWREVVQRAGLSDVRIHDLRRGLASWAAIEGASLPVLAKLLGHNDFASTAIYARLDTEPVRMAMEKAVTAMGARGK